MSEGKIATSTGLMNLLGAAVGGAPMCHGAGGMAGHVQFGARTGGALVILGVVLLTMAMFFCGSVSTLLRLFPPSILGVILFLTSASTNCSPRLSGYVKILWGGRRGDWATAGGKQLPHELLTAYRQSRAVMKHPND